MDTNKKDIKTVKDYKSTPSRVIHSLGLSNHRLKEKNENRKSETKRLSVRVKDLEESRDKWKMKVKKLSEELEKAHLKIKLFEEKKAD